MEKFSIFSSYSIKVFLSCYLPNSKAPNSKFSESKEVRWGIGLPVKVRLGGLIKVSLYIFHFSKICIVLLVASMFI
ncbi:hypothetical protein E7Y01_16900 [Bacillus sp. HUB-I-004]|nr:hypothetical protein E7Y01_16900 [Bacillus sp. HUB-I-004]